MTTKLLQQITTAAFSILISTLAWAAPTSGPYVTDPTSEYVQDATSESIGNVNMILCIVDAMNISGSGMLNNGAYIALIDINKCQSHGGSSSSSSSSSGASVSTNYMTALVNATRGAASTDPMIAKIWMSLTEQGKKMDIYLRLSASQSPTAVPPYGVFRLDYIGKDGVNALQFNGFIDSIANSLQFYETGPNSSNIALALTPGTSNSGSGTITVGSPTPNTFNFNYNSTNFRRGDSTPSDRCFDRTKALADKSVWRYGTYKDSDGTRVDQTNPGFPITATYASNSYYGWASYYGLGFQGLDLNTIADANPIPALVVTDQRPGNTTTYNLSKVGGKLTKWTRNATTLSVMDGIPFFFNGDLTGKTPNAALTSGSWQMIWKNSPAGFTVIGQQVCTTNCSLQTLATPATVNAGAFNGISISGWSDSFGGNIDIPPPVGTDHVLTEPVNYYSQSSVIPGSTPLTLNCLNNCPDTASVGAANVYTTGTAPSPYGGATATQSFSAPAGSTVSYTFGASGLLNGTTPIIITNAKFYTGNYQLGVQTGRLFDTLFTTCLTSSVCEPSNPATYYTWSTGLGQWNQSMWLTKTSNSTIVAFDPPQNIQYTVPANGTTWAGKQIQLQFNGFGNLYGIPGYCVSPLDNTQVACGPNTRYVPLFSIPDAATMTLGNTTLIVKALDAELRLKNIGSGAAAPCNVLTLTPLTPPTGGVHDMTSSADAYYLGTKPSPVSTSPKVIDGVVQ